MLFRSASSTPLWNWIRRSNPSSNTMRHIRDSNRRRIKKQYFIVPSGFKAVVNRLVIPKFTEGIKYRDESTIPESIKQIVITKDVDRYYASIQYETNEKLVRGMGVVGLDMGVKHFLTTSDGIQIEPLNALKKREKQLKGNRRGYRERRGDRRTGRSRS